MAFGIKKSKTLLHSGVNNKTKEVLEYFKQEIIEYANKHQVDVNHFHIMYPEAHPLVVAAARKYRLLSESFKQFNDELNSALRSLDYTKFGYGREIKMDNIVVWHPTTEGKGQGKVISFPTLTVDRHMTHRGHYYGREMKHENALLPEYSETLVASLMNKIEAGHPSVSDIRRGMKMLNERRHMNLTRVLSRHLTVDGKKLSPTFIDNLAEKMIDVYKPMQYNHAKTTQEMEVMYTRGPDSPTSCMDSSHTFNTNPVHWYAHCPVTEGRYVSRGNNVLARTIIYKNQETNKWYYNRIYGNRDVYTQELKKKMSDEGISFTDNVNDLARGNKLIEFTAPTKLLSGHHYCGFPFFDMLPAVYCAYKFDHDDNLFKWILTSDQSNIPSEYIHPAIDSTCGIVCSDSSQQGHCCGCGESMDDAVVTNVRGRGYCCYGCAEDDNNTLYTTSTTSEWRPYVRDFRDLIHCLHQPCVITNERAGLSNTSISVFYPKMWADTEGFCFTHDELTSDGYTNALNHNRQSYVNFTVVLEDSQGKQVLPASRVVVLENHRHNPMLSQPLLSKYKDSDVVFKAGRIAHIKGLTMYNSFFLRLDEATNETHFERPTVNMLGISRVSIDSLKDVKGWSLAVSRENINLESLDESLFSDWYNYDEYKDEHHGEPINGVKITTTEGK